MAVHMDLVLLDHSDRNSRISAAICNFVVPGLGYLYLRRRTLFGWILLIGGIIGLYVNVTLSSSIEPAFALSQISALVIRIAFAYDVFVEGTPSP